MAEKLVAEPTETILPAPKEAPAVYVVPLTGAVGAAPLR